MRRTEEGIPIQASPLDNRYPFWNFEELALLLGSILPALIVGSLAVRVGRMLAPEAFAQEAVAGLVYQGVFYALLMGALYALVCVRHGRPFWSSLGWTLAFRGAWQSLLAAPILAIGLSWIAERLHAPILPNPFENLMAGRFSQIVVMLFVTTIGPIWEELMFRGFLLPLLEAKLGPWAAIVLTAIPFALIHGAQYQWAWQILLTVGISGLAFGYVRVRTGSTAASALMHIAYNATLFIVFLIQRSF